MEWYNNVIEKRQINKINDIKSFASKIYLIKFNKKKLYEIYNSLNFLSKEFKRRILLMEIYKRKLRNQNIKLLHTKKTFIPWRLSFLINKKDYYLDLIRKKGNDASSYYPNIERAFNYKKNNDTYNNSDFIQKNIINLWLTKEYNQIRINKICKILNEK